MTKYNFEDSVYIPFGATLFPQRAYITVGHTLYIITEITLDSDTIGICYHTDSRYEIRPEFYRKNKIYTFTRLSIVLQPMKFLTGVIFT